jgi:CheY-like chemotaxis protein
MADPQAPDVPIALVGLTEQERAQLQAVLAAQRPSRQPRYALAAAIDRAEWLVADAEHTPSVKLVLASEQLKRTLWVGTPPPMGSVAVAERPLDAEQVLVALDLMMARRAAPSAVAAAPAVPVATGPKRALLVDDSELALRFLETRLARFGLVTECVPSSNHAIERLAAGAYDFVFIDIELGPASTLDGYALARHIHRQHAREAQPPVLVVVSAHATPSDRARSALAGCEAHLAKPLDEVELQRLMLRHGVKPRQGSVPG